jgi:hypothetical protein
MVIATSYRTGGERLEPVFIEIMPRQLKTAGDKPPLSARKSCITRPLPRFC